MRLLLLRMALPFQSTHPVRGGTYNISDALVCRLDFNPPTP